jgi:hypothetical protein
MRKQGRGSKAWLVVAAPANSVIAGGEGAVVVSTASQGSGEPVLGGGVEETHWDRAVCGGMRWAKEGHR